MEKKLTYLEKKLLEDVIAPAVSGEKPDHLYSKSTMSQDLNFVELLRGVKRFYKNNAPHGSEEHWNEIVLKAAL